MIQFATSVCDGAADCMALPSGYQCNINGQCNTYFPDDSPCLASGRNMCVLKVEHGFASEGVIMYSASPTQRWLVPVWHFTSY